MLYTVSSRKASIDTPSRHLPLPGRASVLFEAANPCPRATLETQSIREQVRELGTAASDGDW